MILCYEVIVDDLQHAVRNNEDQFGMQSDDRFNLFQGIDTGLENSPQLTFLEVFVFLLPGVDFLLKGDQGVFIDCVDFIGIGAEVIVLFLLDVADIEHTFS